MKNKLNKIQLIELKTSCFFHFTARLRILLSCPSARISASLTRPKNLPANISKRQEQAGAKTQPALLFFASFSRFFTDFIRRWLALLRRQDVVFYRRSQLFSLPIPTRIRILPLSLCLWTRISHFTVEHKRCIGSSKVRHFCFL